MTGKLLTRQDAVELFGGNEGRQAMDSLVREGFGRPYAYYFPEFEKVEQAANLWQYLSKQRIEKPVRSDKIIQKIYRSITGTQKLVVFSPWGPRYKNSSPMINPEDPEVTTLKELRKIFDQIEDRGICLDFILMPADSYAIEINKMPDKFVNDYFNSLREAVSKILGDNGTSVIPWSWIKYGRVEVPNVGARYALLKESVNSKFEMYVNPEEFRKATKTARAINPDNPQERARQYCVERIVEGIMIYELYNPVKFSLVRKEKDELDGPLSRLYVVKNRAPWMV